MTVENRLLKEKIRELEEKCGYYESSCVDKSLLSKLEHKTRDLEGKLEFESTFRTRVQNQLERVKQQYESSSNEIEVILGREKKCEEQLRKAQRNNKELLEEYGEIKKKLIDLEETRKRLEQQNEILERELETAKSELNVSGKRLEAFQNALNEINDDDEDDVDDDDDDEDEIDQQEDEDEDEDNDDDDDGDEEDEESSASGDDQVPERNGSEETETNGGGGGGDVSVRVVDTTTNNDILANKMNRIKMNPNPK